MPERARGGNTVTVHVVCHINEDRAYGGVRVLYRHVDVLNAAGIPAAVVHGVPGFRCTWFENATRVVSAPTTLAAGDLLVLPEAFAPRLGDLAPGTPKVVLNQNAFYTWHGVPPGADPHPYRTAPDLLAVGCVSEHNRDLLTYAFPGLPVVRLRLGLDQELFRPPGRPVRRRLAYMSRKRPQEAQQVLGMLRARGALAGWEVVELHGLTQAQVAAELRTCALFLSFCEHEGFGLPPLEALASGCFVIGYTGSAAREFFDPRFSREVPDGDVLTFAREVEAWTAAWDGAAHAARAAQAAAFVRSAYSEEQEVASVLAFYREALAAAARRPGPERVLHPADTVLADDLTVGTGLLYRRVRRAGRVLVRGY